MYFYSHLPIKEVYSHRLVMLLVEEMKINISEVDSEQIDHIFFIFRQLPQKFFLVFLFQVILCLT